MALYDPRKNQKNREWRRWVRVKARVNSPEGWRDASILNVSSRGLMIHSGCSTGPGELIEIRGGDQLIKARVVWRKGSRAGLRSNYILPVMDIISLAEKTAADDGTRNGSTRRRARPRPSEPAPQWPRLLELASVAGMGALAIAGLAWIAAGAIFDRLGAIETALKG